MTLIHKPYHIALIRAHEKTETRREWKENYNGPVVGAVHMAVSADMVPEGTPPIHASHDDCDCYVQVLDKYRQPLGDVTDENARNEGDYESVAEFREGYERVYGAGAWDPEKVVTVVEYEYVGREKPDRATTIAGCPNCRPDGFDPAVEAMKALILGEDGSKAAICDYHRSKMDETARELNAAVREEADD